MVFLSWVEEAALMKFMTLVVQDTNISSDYTDRRHRPGRHIGRFMSGRALTIPRRRAR